MYGSSGCKSTWENQFDLGCTERRSDGYHEIRSVMQSIALADQLEISKADKGIHLQVNLPFVEPADNLAYRAAELFTAAELDAGAVIRLEKNLPIAAGLGGGSADAAAVLWALNQLYQTPFTLAELQVIGKQIGADVPFCLQGGTLLAEGIGDKLSLLPTIADYYFVLVKPEQSVSTKKVYQALDPKLFGDHYTSRMVEKLKQGDSITSSFGNIMEQTTVRFVPEVAAWCERMLRRCCQQLYVGKRPDHCGCLYSKTEAEQFIQKWKHQCWMTVTAVYYWDFSCKGIEVAHQCRWMRSSLQVRKMMGNYRKSVHASMKH